MADNESALRDGYGESSDWIEIHNGGDQPVDLAGWFLTDDPRDLTKWRFPSLPASTLDAGEYRVVFASDRRPGQLDPQGYLHTNFRLSADGEYLGLVAADGRTVVSEFGSAQAAYPVQLEDVSYGRAYRRDALTLVSTQSPAAAIVPTADTDRIYGDGWKGGDERGFEEAGGLNGWSQGTNGAGFDRLGEYTGMTGIDLMESMFNVGTSAYLRIPFTVDDPARIASLDLRMLYDDGFVAYLNGVEVVRQFVEGVPAWDSRAATTNHRAEAFESFDLDEFRSLLRSGDNILAIHGVNRTARSSGFLILPELRAERLSDALAEGFLVEPTPGKLNEVPVQGVVADTAVSVERGLYRFAFETQITTATPGATIAYTTDGSLPSPTHGVQVAAPAADVPPLAIVPVSTTTTLRAMAYKPDYATSAVSTHSYLFLADVAAQAAPADYPETWPGTRGDYEVDPDVTQDPLYRDTFADDLASIPIVSLVTDAENLFDRETGIYVNPLQRGVTWERPVSVELLNFPDASPAHIDAGIRIFGGVSRQLDRTPKKSFRLQFKSEYGAAKLEFPFFENSLNTEFDRLMLRGGYNYKWTHADGTQQNRAQYMRDEFSRRSQLAMGQPASHGRHVHVFINGLYWGMYNAVERPDESFAESYFGGAKEAYDVIQHGTPPEAINGDREAWDAMFAIARDRQRTAEEKYRDIQQYLDIDNLIDYMIMIHYTGNVDAPVLIGSTTDPRNFYAIRPRKEGGQFQFFLWDSEHSLSEVTVDRTELGVGNADRTPARLYGELRASAEFRLRFADRVQRHFFEQGALTVDASVQRYLGIAAEIDRAIVGESARWGDVRRSRPYTRDVEWLREQNRIVTQFFPGRHDVILDQWRADGLYPRIAAPRFSQHGGTVEVPLDVSLNAPTGTIYYTLDGSDPRNPATGLPSVSALRWADIPVIVDKTMQLKARVLEGQTWSALAVADFVETGDRGLRITELMYHPADRASGTAEDGEFIELANTGSRPLELNGHRLIGGVRFTFPATELAPGERIVVVSDLAVFRSLYGDTPRVAGEYDGRLDNAGEAIALESSWRQVIHTVRYADDWYDITDGDGYSLVLREESYDAVDAIELDAWRASETMGGNPGVGDSGLNPGSVVINELSARYDGTAGGWVELLNTTRSPLDLEGWYLSDSSQDADRVRLPAGIMIPAGGVTVLTETDHFGPGAGNGPGFRLSGLGGDIVLSSPGNRTGVGGYREWVTYAGSDPGLAYGRYGTEVEAAGPKQFVPLMSPTPFLENVEPRDSDLVLNELMYLPTDGRAEFVELWNRSNRAITVGGPQSGWMLSGDVTFAFDQRLQIPAGGYLVVAGTDPGTFRAQYSVPDDVSVVGPFRGALRDAGAHIVLSRPGSPLTDTTVPMIPADQVRYGSRPPWPTHAAGEGSALARFVATEFGGDAGNWRASQRGGTPGAANTFVDSTPPSVPENLRAERTSDTELTLSWQPAVDIESGVAEYVVSLDGRVVARTDQNVVTISPDFASIDFRYQVAAVNSFGFASPWSAPLAVTKQAVVLSPEAGVAHGDTYLAKAGPTSMLGESRVLIADADAADMTTERRILLRFDVTAVGQASQLLDASLELQLISAPADRQFNVYQVLRAWNESEASWSGPQTGQLWQVPGAAGPRDRGAELLGSILPDSAGRWSMHFTQAGVDVIKQWMDDPATNHGLLLVDRQSLPQPVPATPPPVAPRIHWRFDDDLVNFGSGGTQYAATVVGGAPVFADGQRLRGLDLQNTGVSSSGGQYVSVDYRLTDQGTIAMWYKADELYNFQTLFDNSVDANDWEMWIYDDGRLRTRIESNSGQITTDISNRLSPDGWIHVAFTWDRSDSSLDASRLYVNGQRVGAGRIPLWVEPGQQLFLGGGHEENTYATGTFDDVRVYDYPLSDDQIEWLASDQSAESELAAGLISYWPLDDGLYAAQTLVARDQLGKNHGAVIGYDGAVTWLPVSDAKRGGALGFDGADNHVLIPNTESLDQIGSALTLAAWINLEQLPSEIPQAFSSIFDSEQDAYVLYLDRTANELRFKVTDADGTAERPGIPAALLNRNTWHHVVGVYDGTTGKASIYLDGSHVDTHLNPQLIDEVLSGQVAALGRNGESSQSAFRGAIDEVALWGRALDASDIDALWNDGNGRSVLPESTAPLVYLPLDGTLLNEGTLGEVAAAQVIADEGLAVRFVDTPRSKGLQVPSHDAGTNAYVEVPYQMGEQGTVAVWYFPESFFSDQVILGNAAAQDVWQLTMNGDGVLQFQIDGQNKLVEADLSTLGGPLQWYHVAISWSSVGGEFGSLQFYVNGQSVGTADAVPWGDLGQAIHLGSGADDGALGAAIWDELRIYDRVLPPGDIAQLVRSSEIAAPLVIASGQSNREADRPTLMLVLAGGLLGDVNNDGRMSVEDIDEVSAAIRANDLRGDLNGDGRATQADLLFLVHTIIGTQIGDANLDGTFDSSDLVQIFQAGEYEDAIHGNSTWSDGDWNGDGEFDSSDLVFAYQF